MASEILALGLSPCWQQMAVLDELQCGEVNRAQQVLSCASGKVVNVARAVVALGGHAQMISLAGGLTGEQLRHDVGLTNIDAHWIATQTPTRVCTTLIERPIGRTTEIVENASAISSDELAAFEAQCRQRLPQASVVVVSGSLPAGVPADLWLRLLQGVSARVILDIRGPELSQSLALQPFLVKPNLRELEHSVGQRLTTETEICRAMQDLIAGGASTVLVTNGSEPAWLMTDRECWRIEPPSLQPINPIGCGDCLAAGIAVALARGDDLLGAVRFGSGAAAENATQLLPAKLSWLGTRDWAERVRMKLANTCSTEF